MQKEFKCVWGGCSGALMSGFRSSACGDALNVLALYQCCESSLGLHLQYKSLRVLLIIQRSGPVRLWTNSDRL